MVYTKKYLPPEINRREIFRYAAMAEPSAEVDALLDELIREASAVLDYRVCYSEVPVCFDENGIDFGFCRTASKNLCKNLSGCGSAIVFAATVGIGLDRLIAKYRAVSPAKALLLDAFGAERVESLCDAFSEEVKTAKDVLSKICRPRFSPGYGDLPLIMQKDIFALLDCPRRIGVSLNESLLMSPSKSVTAIIGIADKEKLGELK